MICLLSPIESLLLKQSVSKKNQQHDPSWARAKKLCRLNARQVEMAKKLGMNPKKLPSLIPSKTQQWKQPVGAFIETCYVKRFGGSPDRRQDATEASPARRGSNVETLDSWPEEPFTDLVDHDEVEPPTSPNRTRDHTRSIADDVIHHLINVAEDLQRDLANGRVTRETMTSIARDLRRVAREIDADAGVSQMPYTDLDDRDDEIPF